MALYGYAYTLGLEFGSPVRLVVSSGDDHNGLEV